MRTGPLGKSGSYNVASRYNVEKTFSFYVGQYRNFKNFHSCQSRMTSFLLSISLRFIQQRGCCTSPMKRTSKRLSFDLLWGRIFDVYSTCFLPNVIDRYAFGQFNPNYIWFHMWVSHMLITVITLVLSQ